MGCLKDGVERPDERFGKVFAGELARSLARGIVATARAVMLAVVHRLIG